MKTLVWWATVIILTVKNLIICFWLENKTKNQIKQNCIEIWKQWTNSREIEAIKIDILYLNVEGIEKV